MVFDLLSYLTYTGEPRIENGMLIAFGARYGVEIVDAAPMGFDVEVTGEGGSTTLLYPSVGALLRDWEPPFTSLRIDSQE